MVELIRIKRRERSFSLGLEITRSAKILESSPSAKPFQGTARV